MNRTEIMNILPHRDPMLLVDEVYLENDVAYATYTVKGDEFFLQGHFPNYPVVPGVILCEIMAQSSCLLLVDELVGRTPFYAGIDKVRFKRHVRPGDLLQIKAQIIQRKNLLFVVNAEIKVSGSLCVSGLLTFVLVDNDKVSTP